jgi:hypothetical protein
MPSTIISGFVVDSMLEKAHRRSTMVVADGMQDRGQRRNRIQSFRVGTFGQQAAENNFPTVDCSTHKRSVAVVILALERNTSFKKIFHDKCLGV